MLHFCADFQEGLENENDSLTSLPAPTTTSESSNACSGVSLTNQNITFLNDRLNKMQTILADLSGNVQTINKQMEQLAQQNTEAAADLVGTKPFDFNDQTGGSNPNPSSSTPTENE